MTGDCCTETGLIVDVVARDASPALVGIGCELETVRVSELGLLSKERSRLEVLGGLLLQVKILRLKGDLLGCLSLRKGLCGRRWISERLSGLKCLDLNRENGWRRIRLGCNNLGAACCG